MDLHNLRHFKQPENILLFVQVFVSLIVLKILIETKKLPRLLKLLEPKKRITFDDSKIEYTVKFTNFFLYSVFRSSNPCLYKSLLLFRQLRMMDLDIKIAFGIKDDTRGLKGHAWLIFNEIPFLDQGDATESYSPIYIYP